MLSRSVGEVLYSPASVLSRNGSVEAGVGARKGRTASQVLRRGREVGRGGCRGGVSGVEGVVCAAKRTRGDACGDVSLASESGRGRTVGVTGRSRASAEELWLARCRSKGVGRESVGHGLSVACDVTAGAGGAGHLVLSWRRIPLQVMPQKTDKIT
jgi:hypothetical protein